jgi:hypothetical protein
VDAETEAAAVKIQAAVRGAAVRGAAASAAAAAASVSAAGVAAALPKAAAAAELVRKVEAEAQSTEQQRALLRKATSLRFASVADKIAEADVCPHGVLLKKSDGVMRARYQARHFRVEMPFLVYSRQEGGDAKADYLNLLDIVGYKTDKADKFTLVTDAREYKFKLPADSAITRDEWVSGIERAAANAAVLAAVLETEANNDALLESAAEVSRKARSSSLAALAA